MAFGLMAVNSLDTSVQLIVIENVVMLFAVLVEKGTCGAWGCLLIGAHLEDSPHMKIAAGCLSMRVDLIDVFRSTVDRRGGIAGGLLAKVNRRVCEGRFVFTFYTKLKIKSFAYQRKPSDETKFFSQTALPVDVDFEWKIDS